MMADKKEATPDPAQADRKAAGRPPMHEEPYSKVTVVLMNRQIAFLDRLAIDIRERTGKATSRAELIRVLVDLLAESGIDLAEVAGSPEPLKAKSPRGAAKTEAPAETQSQQAQAIKAKLARLLGI